MLHGTTKVWQTKPAGLQHASVAGRSPSPPANGSLTSSPDWHIPSVVMEAQRLLGELRHGRYTMLSFSHGPHTVQPGTGSRQAEGVPGALVDCGVLDWGLDSDARQR